MSFKEGIIFLFMFLIIIGLFTFIIIKVNSTEYEYVDLNDNKGIAKFCKIKTMTCSKSNGAIFRVKEFKVIR